jgi:hypothetical protein
VIANKTTIYHFYERGCNNQEQMQKGIQNILALLAYLVECQKNGFYTGGGKSSSDDG